MNRKSVTTRDWAPEPKTLKHTTVDGTLVNDGESRATCGVYYPLQAILALERAHKQRSRDVSVPKHSAVCPKKKSTGGEDHLADRHVGGADPFTTHHPKNEQYRSSMGKTCGWVLSGHGRIVHRSDWNCWVGLGGVDDIIRVRGRTDEWESPDDDVFKKKMNHIQGPWPLHFLRDLLGHSESESCCLAIDHLEEAESLSTGHLVEMKMNPTSRLETHLVLPDSWVN
ncbi:hypothetical protein C8R45DRAFT_1077430 [Mycena sanguinolenta]|nr:hypothetical protein C8R45DRAFT_1077430 [Mycena sanguinolenta]